MRICSIEGCMNPYRAKGWCNMHYKRFRTTGDPLGLKVAEAGERISHLKDIASKTEFETDCMIWPFGRNKRYPTVSYKGKVMTASRLVFCLHTNEWPSGETECAHNCGKGHIGCVNPSHLRWATRAENAADRFVHGTIARGEVCGSSKLTEEQVLAIVADTRLSRVISLEYGVTTRSIQSIKSGETWSWFTGILPKGFTN